MKRGTGIGGIFFHAKDPAALQAWYRRSLGIDVQAWGGTAFTWTDASRHPLKGTTIGSIGAAGGDAFAPSASSFMINYRVDDLAALRRSIDGNGTGNHENDNRAGRRSVGPEPEDLRAKAGAIHLGDGARVEASGIVTDLDVTALPGPEERCRDGGGGGLRSARGQAVSGEPRGAHVRLFETSVTR